MIQVKIYDERVTNIYYGETLIEGFIRIESIPSPEEIPGKIPVMYYRNGAIVYEYEVIPEVPEEEVSIEQLKSRKIDEITQYDTSSSVNEFYLGELPMWLDKATRVGLMNSTQIEKATGNETTTLWFGTISFKLNCDIAIQMLSALELYALDCYNRTAEHKANVEKFTTKEEVENYNYKTGYPEKLKFEL